MTNAIVYGQLLTPKRIVFLGDTGVFFTNKQEVELLVKFKQLENCKLEVNSWKKYAANADIQIGKERAYYDSLNTEYVTLSKLAKEYKDKYEGEYNSHQQTILKLEKQKSKTITWRKWAIGLGAGNLLLGGTLYMFLTH